MKEVHEVMQKLGKANKLMEDLIDIAMDDQKIKEDEKQMLFKINENLAAYAKKIIEVLEDNKVEDLERQELKDIEHKIVTDAHEVAKGDNYVSEDEKKILNQLVNTIQSI